MRPWWIVGPFCIALCACADAGNRSEVSYEPTASVDGAAAPGTGSNTDAPAPTADAASADDADTSSIGKGEATAARKIYYEGTLKLESPDPESVVHQAVAHVQALGGYAELETKDSAVLHVPQISFQATYADLQKLGKVLEKTLTGADITDSYNDTALHKKLAEASLHKLEQLLAAAKSASERLALLKEIGEVKGRLEVAEAKLATLAQMAKFSLLTLTAVQPPREVAGLTPAPIGAFAWIDRLKPDQRLAPTLGKRVELPVPADFVALPVQGYWMAESASQANFSATRLSNEPRGDSHFWAEALRQRLQERFKVAAVESHGKFQVVRLKANDDESYHYDVAVLAQGDALIVAEAFYADDKDEQRFAPKVLATLEGVEGKGL